MPIKPKYYFYPLWIFILLLVVKFGYIIVESYYNYYVLTITTSKNFTVELAEELNKNGHLISATGITLLLFPLIYFIINKIKNTYKYLIFIIFLFSTFLGTYHSLNMLIDKIVEYNNDKRYEAYYLNIFKYGIVNNIFSYNSFINYDKIANNKLNVNDRLLLSNTFLLLEADKELLTRLRKKGEEHIINVYIDTYYKEDFTHQYNKFKDFANSIQTQWDKIVFSKEKIQDKYKAIDSYNIQEEYNTFKTTLINKYSQYIEKTKGFNKKLTAQTTTSSLMQFQRDLTKYFRYRAHSSAQKQYKNKMVSTFGRNIKDTVWLDRNGKITREHIKKTIEYESYKSINFLPVGLNAKDFYNHHNTKTLVAKELKEKGILIPKDFDYSYQEFEKYFKVMQSKLKNDLANKFSKNIDKEITLSTSKMEFLNSKIVNEKLSKYFTSKEDIKTIKSILLSHNLSKFKSDFYASKLRTKLQIYTKNEFYELDKAISLGNEAIKLLYIPPIALAISIIALLLNIVSIMFMIIFRVVRMKTYVKLILKTTVYSILICLPLIFTLEVFNNQLLVDTLSDDMKIYFSFLKWLSFYEQLNYELVNEIISILTIKK